MDDLQNFIKLIIEVMDENKIDSDKRSFELFRKSITDKRWVIYACIKNENDIQAMICGFCIYDGMNFHNVLNMLVDSGIKTSVHAYYFNDVN